MLDEMERALHDSLSIVKRTLESNTVNFVSFFIHDYNYFRICFVAIELSIVSAVKLFVYLSGTIVAVECILDLDYSFFYLICHYINYLDI